MKQRNQSYIESYINVNSVSYGLENLKYMLILCIFRKTYLIVKNSHMVTRTMLVVVEDWG